MSEAYTIKPETNLEGRVAFKRLTGLTLRLTPWELLTAIKVEADTIVIQVITHEVSERKTSTILLSRGIRLTQFKMNDNGTWSQTFVMPVVWDTDFERVTYSLFGAGKTPEQWLAAREFARICYRPGSDHQPMDSSYRVSKGYTTVKMARHWQ